LGAFAGDVAFICHNDDLSSAILARIFDIASVPRYYTYYMNELQIVMVVALVISVVLHEMAHGYAANWLGDPTARLQGRLSANPLVHIDPLMSVIIPGLLIVSGSPFLFGAAKPVPYNPYNFTNQKWGEAIVAAAGPAANIAIALIFAGLIHMSGVIPFPETFVGLAINIIVLNIFLALFNLVPIPPLDGSKILPRLLPFTLAMKYENFRFWLERNVALSFALVIMAFILFLGAPLQALTTTLTGLLLGF
jgi:Zn-dependent protease